MGANLIRYQLQDLPSGAAAGATLLCSTLLVMPLAVLTWPKGPIPWSSWVSALIQGTVCTGAAYILYFRLNHRLGASRAAAVTYLVPGFGALWGWLVLGEPVSPRMIGAGALILCGVAMNQVRA